MTRAECANNKGRARIESLRSIVATRIELASQDAIIQNAIESRKTTLRGDMTEPMFRCPGCAADPKPENFGSERRCAFDATGNFTPENWNCVTLNLLLDKAESVEGCDEMLEHRRVNTEQHGGWIITSRYKHRGCTSSAIWVGDFFPPRPVTLDLVERILSGDLVEPAEYEDEQ